MPNFSIIEKGCPLDRAEKALILLHGRGGTAEGMIRLADEFTDESFYVAAPQAPENSWYPNSFLKPVETNEPWLSDSIERIRMLVEKIAVVIPLNSIYIMGFSQGACLSLEFAARHPGNYGGIAAFSGGLIGDKLSSERYTGTLEAVRIFIGNSDEDPFVPFLRSDESATLLKKMGAEVLYKIYEGMEHTITPVEIRDVRKFMFSN
jgi:phospholipase/carboxylesterase